MDILTEPVRGGYPPPEWWALPGLDRVRAFVDGLVPDPPLARLFGMRVTHASPGAATVTMPASPWFSLGPRTISIVQLTQRAAFLAALTIVGPDVRLASRSIGMDFVRAPVVEMRQLVAKARVVTAGGDRVTTEVAVEDADGRLVARSMHQNIQAMPEPHSPASRADSLPPYDEPRYDTPDPAARPVPYPLVRRSVAEIREDIDRRDGRVEHPMADLLGFRLRRSEEGTGEIALPSIEWFCSEARATHQIVPAACMLACTWAATSVLGVDRGPVANTFHLSEAWGRATPATLDPDGRDLVVRAHVVHDGATSIIADGEFLDADGNRLSLARLVCTPTDLPVQTAETRAERVLLTVLFVDVVDSTATAERLGDAKWRELIERMGAVSDDAVVGNRGRVVKNAGDGFLATFDSPARAVACAQTVRDGFAALGLQIRAGVHLGEVELVGDDVAGIAVHVASRVESAAAPGTIYATSTVREAAAGSGLRFEPRGGHRLKGVEEEWQLFSAE